MGRSDLISRLNSHYEELSVINSQIEKFMKESVPPTEKIAELLNRKDHLIEKCIHIKNLLERNQSNSDEMPELNMDSDEKEARKRNSELLEKMLNEESLNRELAENHLQSIRKEISKIRTSKNKLRQYNKKHKKSGSSIDKKV